MRFRRPVFDGDRVRCVVTADGDAVRVDGVTDEPDQPRAVVRATRDAGPVPEQREGETLRTVEVVLAGEWASDYARRAGDDLDLCPALGVVHPAVWPGLANHVVHTQVARGSWIHTRSIVRHHGLAPDGATAIVRSAVVRRFDSHGERAVLDVWIEVGGSIVATLEHEAIVRLP